MAEEVIVLNILKSLKKRLNLILSITFLSIATVWFLLEFVITPNYQATTQIWVEELVDETPEGDMLNDQIDPTLMRAHGTMVKSGDVLEETKNRLNLPYTVRGLSERITVTQASNAQVLIITVNSSDSQEAIEIANTLTAVLEDVLMGLFETDNITVITEASEETVVSSFGDNLIFELGLAGAFGLIVGILIAFIIEMLNTVFKNNKRNRRRKTDKDAKLQTVFK